MQNSALLQCEIQKTTVQNPGARQKVDKCELCQSKFGMMVKQHQCKRCLRPVCHECAKDKAITYHFDIKVAHRMCKSCRKEQQLNKEALENFQEQRQVWAEFILYQQMDKIFLRIASVITIIQQFVLSIQEKDVDQNFLDVIAQVEKKQQQDEILFILNSLQATYSDIIQDFHYSSFEQHYLITKDIEGSEIISKIKQVLKVFLFNHPKYHFQKKIVYEILYLLYFNGPGCAYFFLSFIYDEFLPERFSGQIELSVKPLEQELDFLIEIAKTNFLIQAADLVFVRKFLENYSNVILSHMFMNILNAPCVMFIFELAIRFKDFYECEKALVLIVKLHLDTIKSRGLDEQYIQRYILNNTQYTKLKENFSREDRVKSKMVPRNSKGEVPHSKSDDVFQTFNDFRSSSLLFMQNEHVEIISVCLNILEQTQPGTEINLTEQQNKVLLKLSYQEQRQFNAIKNRLASVTTPDDKSKLTKHNLSEVAEDANEQRVSIGDGDNKQTEQQIEALKQQNQDLSNENSQLKDQVTALAADQISLNDKLNKAEAYKKTLSKQIQDLEFKQYDQSVVVQQKDKQIKQQEITIKKLEETQKESQQSQEQIFDAQVKIQTLEARLLEQKILYDEKLRSSAVKQQEQIMKLIKEFEAMQPQKQTMPQKRSQTIIIQPNPDSNAPQINQKSQDSQSNQQNDSPKQEPNQAQRQSINSKGESSPKPKENVKENAQVQPSSNKDCMIF